MWGMPLTSPAPKQPPYKSDLMTAQNWALAKLLLYADTRVSHNDPGKLWMIRLRQALRTMFG